MFAVEGGETREGLQICCHKVSIYFQIFGVHRAVHRNIISIVKPTRCTNVSNLFYFGMTLYMFRMVFPSIIRSSRLCQMELIPSRTR